MDINFQILINTLKHGSTEARQQAAKKLGNSGDPRAIEPLVTALRQDKGESVREECVKALSNFNDDRAIEALIEAIRDPSWSVRRAAVNALVKFKDIRSIEPLVAALQDERSDIEWLFERKDILDAISAFGFDALDPLIGVLALEDDTLRRDVIAALSKLGRPAVERLMAALRSKTIPIRKGVAIALGDLGDSQAVKLLIATLQDDDPTIATAAATSLGKIHDARAVEPLIGSTRHASSQVRAAAAEALGELDNEQAIHALLTLLTDGSPSVQVQAAMSLGKLGQLALPSLLTRLRDEKEQMRDTAATALAFMGGIALKPLLVTLKDPDWRVRQSAATSIGRLVQQTESSLWNKPDSTQAEAWLESLLADLKDSHFMADPTDVAKVKSLSAGLKDPNFRVDPTQAEAMVESLLAGLKDPDFRVRKAVATALGHLGGHTVVQFKTIEDSLFAMLQRKHELARQEAANALLKLGGGGFVGSALEHPDDAVRLVIVTAIRNYIDAIDVEHEIFPYWFPVDKYRRVKLRESASTIVKTLVKLTRDPNKYVREAALLALATIREKLAQERDRGQTTIAFSEGPKYVPGTIFDFPSQEELDEEKAAAGAIEAATLDRPATRYADFAFYDTGKRPAKVPDGYTLRSEQWYQLEVAVRVKPTGIPPKEQRDTLKEPRQKEAVTVMVTAEGEGFEIEEPVQPLVLPPLGDSTKNAHFRVRPLRRSASSGDLADIRVRLYYQFNLIEVAVIYAEVCGKFDSPVQSRLGLEKPISFQQERIEREYRDFDDVRPRAMHIDIIKREETIVLHFAFSNDLEQEVVFTAPVRLQAKELEDDLMSIRKSWYDISLSKTFSEQVEGDKDEFLENVRNLAKIGYRLWVKLFKRELGSSLYQIGMWLEEHPLKEGSLIQISVENKHDAANFIFPWTLIYDRPLPKRDYELPELEGFWGIRYCIEQQLPGIPREPDKPIHIEDRLKLEFMLWNQFRNAKLENDLMDQLKAKSTGKLEISTPPITDADTCYGILSDCKSHILYFYTHGYTRHLQADIGVGPNLELFKRRYERLDKDSPVREAYKLLYESIEQGKFEPDRSWIELTWGKVYLDELYANILHLQSEPFVILNMCESAQVTPSLSESFIHFFLTHGANGVIGTECPMTVEFAHPFAEMLLNEILAGREVGVALLNARRHFMELKNPLGLAYTLFGSATVSFEPPMF